MTDVRFSENGDNLRPTIQENTTDACFCISILNFS